MWQSPQFSADLVTFTEDSVNKILHILGSVSSFNVVIIILTVSAFNC